MNRFIVSILLLLFATMAFANNEDFFPADKKEYLEKLKIFMTKSNQESMVKVYSDYESLFNAGKFDEAEFQLTLEVLNQMHTNKLKASPYSVSYTHLTLPTKRIV